MKYKILEARIEYDGTVLIIVSVLVDCTGTGSEPLTDVRAIQATNMPCQGYYYLMPNTILNDDLLQKVAALGRERPDIKRIFYGSKYLRKGGSE